VRVEHKALAFAFDTQDTSGAPTGKLGHSAAVIHIIMQSWGWCGRKYEPFKCHVDADTVQGLVEKMEQACVLLSALGDWPHAIGDWRLVQMMGPFLIQTKLMQAHGSEL